MHELQRKFLPLIEAGQMTVDSLCGQPVRAYNVQIWFSPETIVKWKSVTRQLYEVCEDNLLVLPAESLHISIFWIIDARQVYPSDKDLIWENLSSVTLAQFSKVVSEVKSFEISFGDIVLTDSAVICIGQDNGTVQALRNAFAKSIPLPPETRNNHTIIHVTLGRLVRHPNSPVQLLASIFRVKCELMEMVRSIEIRKELIYPSLETEVVFRQTLLEGAG